MQAVAERISAGRQPVAVPERSYENGEDSPILAGGNDVVPKGRARKQGALKEAEQDTILKRGSRGKFQKVLDLPGFPDTGHSREGRSTLTSDPQVLTFLSPKAINLCPRV